jgi:hypothetical protein
LPPGWIGRPVLIACWRFPKQTGDFISRITSIGAGGVKANPPPSPDVANQEVKDLSRPNIGDELMKLVDNQAIQNSENFIRDTLLPGIAPAERENVLARHLAAAWMILAYEGTYNQIWGSQLFALQALNESRGLSRDVVNVWYQYGVGMNPERFANYPFDSWLGWMHGMFLIETRPDGLIYITITGNDFLQYIIRNRYSMHKEG